MLRFYLALILEIPSVFRTKTESYLFWVLSVAVPVWLLWRPSLRPIVDSTEFSRWFVFVPIGVSVAYGMLRANYERFNQIKQDADDARIRLNQFLTGRPRLLLCDPGAWHVQPVQFHVTIVGPTHLRAPTGQSDFLKVRFTNDP